MSWRVLRHVPAVPGLSEPASWAPNRSPHLRPPGVSSGQARQRPPMGGLGPDRGCALGAGKNRQVVEVGKDPALRLSAPCVVRGIAGEMIARASAVNEDGDAASAALCASQATV